MFRKRLLIAFGAFVVVGLLAVACQGEEEEEGPTPTPEASPSPGAASVDIAMVPTLRFDKEELRIPAAQSVTVDVDNQDTGIQHNFAVYTSKEDAGAGEDPLFATERCTAPCQDSVILLLDPGEYFFRCDVHPTQMTGRLIVE